MIRNPDSLGGPIAAIAWVSMLFVLAATTANAMNAGDLDTSFGGDGIVMTSFGDRSVAFAVDVQPDGRILVGGDTYVDGLPSFALARYTPDGDLDATFGSDGLVTTVFAGSGTVFVTDLAVQPDEKVVVAGLAHDSIALARYLPDGTLDLTFGTAGVVLTPIAPSLALARGLALQPDGKMVVVGEVFRSQGPDITDLVVARYHADGRLDRSFGDAGVIISDFQQIDSGNDVALQRDRKIVVAGTVNPLREAELQQFFVARYLPDGTPDMTFGDSGHVTSSFVDGGGGVGSAVAIQGDDKIVVGGGASVSPQSLVATFTLLRYHPDGSLDRGFGEDGVVSTGFGPRGASINDVALQPDGKIVAVGGRSLSGFAVARYSFSGALDASFGASGRVTLSFGPGSAIANSVTIQPRDGHLVVAGWSGRDSGHEKFTIVRLRASVEPGFSLHCPGDINGDGVAELVLLTPTGEVRVKDLDGAEINNFQLAGVTGPVDSVAIPDTNGNGAAELAALGGSPAIAAVRDLLTGGDLGSIEFDTDLAPVDLELVGDRTGNGIPELASLGLDPMRVEVRDGLTGTVVIDAAFTSYVTGRDLTIYPDVTGIGAPELAVLAENRRQDSADKIEIRNTSTGAIIRQIWLGRGWRVLEQALIADLNGNGFKEVAVLRVHPNGRVNVQIRDSVTRAWLNFVGFAVEYPPRTLLSIADINGNGAGELVVFGRRVDGSDQKAVIKDSKTGQKLGQLRFDKDFPEQDFVDCGDLNGNGATDLALVGRRTTDQQIKVVIKDSKTGEQLADVWF